MPRDFQYDVFLSRNHPDKPWVRRLKGWNRCGATVHLAGGVASGWVALERSTAVHREPSNVGRRFIPLLLDDFDLPETLRRYKYMDFREEAEPVASIARERDHPVATVVSHGQRARYREDHRLCQL